MIYTAEAVWTDHTVPKIGFFFEWQLSKLVAALEIYEPVDFAEVSHRTTIASGFTVSYSPRVRRLVYIGPHHAALKISLLTFPMLGEYLASIFSHSFPANKTDEILSSARKFSGVARSFS